MAARTKTRKRVVLLIWGLVAAIVVLGVVFFDVTPADLAHQVSRCLRCH